MTYKIIQHLDKNDTITLEAWDDNGDVIDTINTGNEYEAIEFSRNYTYTRIIN